MSGDTHPKGYYHLVENFHVYLQAKKSTSLTPSPPSPPPHHAFLEILQRYAHFFLWFFGYFGHTWLHTPRMIVSTCRRLWCLSASLKYISSFTSFLRYYILKNPNWLKALWPITQEPGFCQIWVCWWNINNIIIFHFRLSPGKTNDKNFKRKIKTNLFWGQFWVFLSRFQEK